MASDSSGGTTISGFPNYSEDELEQFGVLSDINGILFEKLRGKKRSDGVYQFEQPFLCRFSTLFVPLPGGTYRIPEYLAPHPALPWALADESDYEQLNGDWCRVLTTYKGVLNGGVPVERSRSTGSTKSIRLSPKFNDIVAYIEALPGFTGDPFCYDIDSNGNKSFRCFGENAGRYALIDSYEDGGAIHSYSYNSTGPSDRWDVLKKIDSPKGNPPEIPETANWILDDIQQEVTGHCYAITETWKSCQGAGADPIIYGS